MPFAPGLHPARRRRPQWPLAVVVALLLAGPARGVELHTGDILVADSSSNTLS